MRGEAEDGSTRVMEGEEEEEEIGGCVEDRVREEWVVGEGRR